MKSPTNKLQASLALLAMASTLASPVFAGQAVPWESVPAAVRATILAHGGKEGQAVDRENRGHNVNGQTLYEASVVNAQGQTGDLDITADGKLVETKTDDAADAAAEKAASAKSGEAQTGTLKFSHPRDITNPYLPLASLKQDLLEGTEGGKPIRVERTALPDRRKTFQIGGQAVEALVVEDRAWVAGQLSEVAVDYFAQDDAGNVYYLGEDVDEYTDGKVSSHEGAWLLGKDTQVPGVIITAHPKVGEKFRSETVSKEISEWDVVVGVDETTTVPAGTYAHCVKVEEHPAGEGVEYKYYAPGVGVVREIPDDGDEQLTSHTTVEPHLK